MAEETINIVELDINQENLVKKLVDLQNALQKTKDETKKLEEANKALEEEGKKGSERYKENAELIQLNKAEVGALSGEYRANQKILQSVTAAGETQAVTIGKLNQRNAQLRAEIRNVDLTDKNAQKTIKEKNREIERNTEIIRKNSDAVVQQKMNIGNYGSALQSIPGPIGAVASKTDQLSRSFKSLLANPVVATLALLAGALSIVYKAFKSTDEGATSLAQTTHNLNARWKTYIATAREYGLVVAGVMAIKKNLTDDVKKYAIEMDKLNDAMVYHKSVSQAVGAEIARLRERAQDQLLSVDERAQALAKSRELMHQELTAQQEFADKRYDLERKSVAEIYEVNEKALHILISADLETSQDLLKNDKSLRDARNKMGDEQFEKLVDQYNERKKLEEDYFTENRRIMTLITGLYRKSEEEKTKATEEQIKKRHEARMKEIEDVRLEKEIDALVTDFEALQWEITIKGINQESAEATKAKLVEYLTKLNELEIAQNELYNQNKLDLQVLQHTAMLDQEQERLNIQKQMELDYAEIIGADTTLIHEKYTIIQKQLSEDVFRSNLQVAADMFGGLSALADEHTKGAKLMAAAEATINTYLGATAAFAQTPGGIVIKSLAAASAIIAGIAAVKRIYAVKKGSKPSSLPAATSSSAPAPQTFSDGGTVMRGMGTNISTDIKRGFTEALQENPIRPVLPIEQATIKQGQMERVSLAAVV